MIKKRKRCPKCNELLFGTGRHYCTENRSSAESDFNNAVVGTALDIIIDSISSSDSSGDSSSSNFDSGGGDFGGGGSSGDW